MRTRGFVPGVAATLMLTCCVALAAPREMGDASPLAAVDRHRMSIVADIVEGFREQGHHR